MIMSKSEVLLEICDKLDRIIELLEAANAYLPEMEDEPVTRFLDTGNPV